MINQAPYQIFKSKHQRSLVLVMAVLLTLSANVAKDFLFSKVHDTSFYISESLLFSSFWLLFPPFIFIKWKLSKVVLSKHLRLTAPLILAIVHVLTYAALVWILSEWFYTHTFSYWQTFNYGLTDYFIITIIIYGLSQVAITIYENKSLNQFIPAGIKNHLPKRLVASIIVSDGNNKKTVIATNDILYFTSNSPYVNIHHPSKKYLQTGTLKSFEAQLDNQQFMRIHKSCIVNICKVVSCQSRRNGDYDLILVDGTVLRVSRNYASAFKKGFESVHDLQ